MQIIVSDLLTQYKRSGQGKTLLLLHGWANSLDSLKSQTDVLSDQYEVISVDLPGFGKSQVPNTSWDLDDYAKFIKLFLEKLNIHNLYAIVGHSNGGALAIRALATNQIIAKKLVLLSASGVRNTNGIKRSAIKAVAKTGKIATFWMPKITKQKLQKKLYGTIGSDLLVVPHMKETFRLTVRQDVQNDAVKIKIPTLLIYGDVDKATPVSTVGQLLHEKIGGSKLEIINGADHFALQTHSEQVNKLTLEFLK